MSKTKFAAAKELIQEKRYDEARIILKTINEPKSQEWLEKLDKLSPEFPEINEQSLPTEQEKYYKRENHKASRRRVANGFELIITGVFCFVLFAFFATPRVNLITGVSEIELGFSWILIPLGIVALIGGIRRMTKKDS